MRESMFFYSSISKRSTVEYAQLLYTTYIPFDVECILCCILAGIENLYAH